MSITKRHVRSDASLRMATALAAAALCWLRWSLVPLLFTVVAAAFAQDDAPLLSTNANLVTLLATVHDRNGRIVNNLTADDFILVEDGVPQKVHYFSQESDLPLTVGLLVDTSRSQQGVLGEESNASATFFDRVLREDKDQAFVMQFDRHVETLQGLTSSHAKLDAALQQLAIPGEFGTLIYSAIRQSSNDTMKAQSGRKAMILLTDGVAFKDDTSINTAIEAAQRADIILYSIRFSDPPRARGPFRAAIVAAAKERGKSDLQRMSKETGGASFEVKGGETIESIYSQIEEALRNQYSIAYTPTRGAPDGKYHTIKLTTKDRNLIVETRDGYFAR